MKKLFAGFYRPTNSEFKKLWSTCIFVLDANVLLNLYRYPEPARKDLFTVLNKIKKRIWVPYQAALEFERNRLTVIAEQHRRFSEVKKVLGDAHNRLESGLRNLQLDKRHSSIDPSSFLGNVKRLFDEFNEQLNKSEEEHTDVCDEDEIRDEISSLLEGKIGSPPKGQKELDDIYVEGESRYRNKIPPGFMDWEKAEGSDPGEFSYGGLLFKRIYGDLILWKQTIRHVKDAKIQSVVFLTDDNKEDWWMVVESKGPKTIGPRPELIDEIRREAGVDLFHMYSSEQFMKNAEEYLNVHIRGESIKQVRDLTVRRQSQTGEIAEDYTFLRAVVNWIQGGHPNLQQLSYPTARADIEVLLDAHTPIGFDIKYLPAINIGAFTSLSDAKRAAVNSFFSEYTLVVATRPGYLESSLGRARIRDMQRLLFNESSDFAYDVIYLGYLDNSGRGAVYRPRWRCAATGAEEIGQSRLNRFEEGES